MFRAMASEESLMAFLSSTLSVRLSMTPGLITFAVPLVFSKDREGHVKLNVSRREPPLQVDVMLCVGVILPVDAVEDDVVDDDDDKGICDECGIVDA